MTPLVQESVKMLPESEQEFASQFIKRMVLAWDPDFTKQRLEAAEQRIDSGDYVKDSDISW